jgi:hexosaminidase
MSDIRIIPQPVNVTPGDGQFALTAEIIIIAPGAAEHTGQQLAAALAPATGWWLPVQASSSQDAGRIDLTLDDALADLGPEGYHLIVTPERVQIRAAGEAGLFYGVQSLLQLLPADIFRAAPIHETAWTIPAVEIEDMPRFGWRGAHLDVGRHFMPKSFVLKFIDLLALHKLNTFHWHLTEDQGWRIEIKRYPRLTEVGAWRKETLVGHWRTTHTNPQYDGVRHGGFYTQDDVREVVAYAAARHVNVVPEIEMPGHAQAAIAAYPELGNNPSEQIEVARDWGIKDNICNAEESTILFMQNVLDEVLALFPSEFIHVGGDEAPKVQWKASPAAQARIRELGLKDEDELQSYFIRRMDAYLTERGRRLIGWDEILEGGLAPNATVMSWRGEKGGIAAATSGHDVVMAPNTYTYLDYLQSQDAASEPLGIGGYLPLETVYSYEPIAAELSAEDAQHVLGAQGQLWTEYLATPRNVEYMAFPRLAALAEVVWTPAANKDYAGFLERLPEHLERLDALDVVYRKP